MLQIGVFVSSRVVGGVGFYYARGFPEGWSGKWVIFCGASLVRPRPRLGGMSRVRILVDWDEQPLGEVTDTELAGRLGICRKRVRRERRRREIPTRDTMFGRNSRLIDWAGVPLGSISDVEVAERVGVSRHVVRYMRRRLGIPAVWRGRDDAVLVMKAGEFALLVQLLRTLAKGGDVRSLASRREFRELMRVSLSVEGYRSTEGGQG